MAEHWIDAATAVNLVIDGPHDLDGMRALCARAHSGLVQTKARLFVVGQGRDEKRQENEPLPRDFWWAKGYEALEQNWTTGDFSTWTDKRVHLEAFGVTFALSGVLEMLPAEQRALAARRLSVAGSPAWMPARQASEFAVRAPGVLNAREVILEQARLGLIFGRAVLAQRYKTSRMSAPSWEVREWDIPVWFWESCLRTVTGARKPPDWSLGLFSAEVPASQGSGWMVLSGVHFLTESLQVLMPSVAAAPAPAPASTQNHVPSDAAPKFKGGGRPPAEWWDDLWCHICGLIYEGGLIPKTQADIERAMHTWANDNGHEPAVSTVRDRARKLFKALEGVGNLPAR